MTHHLASAADRADRLAAAKQIIEEAGSIALNYFERYRTLQIHSKSSSQDLVSIADQAVETFIREQIIARFPEDGLVGEEHGQLPGISPFRWVIDPIDGTSPFLHGLRSWSVVIAVLENDQPVLGLIAHPCEKALYWCSSGEGAFCNDKSIHVDSRTPFTSGITAIGASRKADGSRVGQIIVDILESGGSFMRNGSAALTLAHVAAGHYVGYYEPLLHAWDCLAGLLLVREAGGVIEDFPFSGSFMQASPCFAASPQVAPLLRDIVQ